MYPDKAINDGRCEACRNLVAVEEATVELPEAVDEQGTQVVGENERFVVVRRRSRFRGDVVIVHTHEGDCVHRRRMGIGERLTEWFE
jgi:hypothetical protein